MNNLYNSIFFLLVLVCFYGIPSLAIYNSDEVVTKPPKHRENLPWPKRTYDRESNTKTHGHRHHKTEHNEEHRSTKPPQSYSRARITLKESARPNKISEDKHLERQSYEKKDSSLCEPKTTGQFVYLPDCRRFINCFKGRGYVQVCSPGTLFNPETLECDFPTKVRCLVSPAEYKVIPGYNNEEQFALLSFTSSPKQFKDAVDEPPQPVASSSNHYLFSRGFKSYKVTPPPTGHIGVQPMYGSPVYQPDESIPSEHGTGSRNKPRQYFNVGSPFNIQPTFNNQQPVLTQTPDSSAYPSGSNPNPQQYQPGYVNTYGLPNPGYYINTGVYQDEKASSNFKIQTQSIGYNPGSGYIPTQQQPTEHNSQPGYYSQPLYPQGQPESHNSQPGYYSQPLYPQGELESQSGSYLGIPTGVPQHSQSGYVVSSFPGAPGQPHNIYPTYSQGKTFDQPGYIPSQAGQPTPGFESSRPSQSMQPPIGQTHNGQPSYEQPQGSYPSSQSGQTPYGQPQSSFPSSQSGQPPYGQPQIGQPPYGQPQGSYPSSQSGQPPYGQPQIGQPQGSYPSSQNGQSPYGQPQSGQPSFEQSQGSHPSSQSGQPTYTPSQSGQPSYIQPHGSQPSYGKPERDQSPYEPSEHGHSGYGPTQNGQPSYIQPSRGQPSYSPSSRGRPSYPGAPGYQPPDQNYYPPTNTTRHDQVPIPRDDGKEKCPEGASGLYQHSWNCYKFLSCDHGRTFIMDCGPGTAFNPKLSVCDYPYNVDCSGTEQEKSDHGTDDANVEESRPEPDWTFNNEPSESTADLIEQIDVRMGPPPKPKPPPPPPFPTSKTYHIKPDTPPVEISHNQNKPESSKGTKGHNQTTTTQWIITSETDSRLPADPSKSDIQPEELDHFPKRTPPGRTQKKILTPVKPPRNRQIARLRGGDKPSEGFLEVHIVGAGWGIVCDEPNSWSIEEANIVCKQLGYERGAELTWQGRPNEGLISNFKPVSFDTVSCTGNEVSILDCNMGKGKKCNPERDGVWVRCYTNRQSYCMPGEFSYNGQCYLLVEPKEDAKLESVGFSQGEALAHCQSRSGHLLDITSQDESDFISEWLVYLGANLSSPSVMTSGVGVSVLGRPLWIWEGSEDSFEYNNWWPGWDGGRGIAPKTQSTRAQCVVARRYFPCPNSGVNVIEGQPLCDAEYFFWDAEDCAIMSNKHPYVCERAADKIGCIIGSGVDYKGPANVTYTSTPCLYWDSPLVTPALKYRVSDITFKATLAGHNYCRNVVGSEQEPWCFVRTQTGIKKESCDIPPCKIETNPVEKSGGVATYTCGPNLFACDLNDCIPSAWLCDGSADCKNGYDELNCTGGLDKFTKHGSARLSEKDVEKWLHTSAPNCAAHCLEAKDFVCRSFSHSVKDQVCLLSDSNIGLSGNLNVSLPGWDYYELNTHSVQCTSMFVCGNGKCINKNMTCNGKNDCGDRSDERNCSAANLGYEIRLSGSNSSNEGYIEVKILGEWGVICDDQFDMRDAEVACRELGFSLGAVEIRPHSAFQTINSSKPLYLVDDLQCRGNETSIRDCEFSGWGVHNCGDDEIVGVVCKVPGLMCATNFWQCEATKECIPVAYLCDNIPDCDDGSDEDPARCKSPIEVRLVGRDRSGSSSTGAGRVEVRRFGIWGTICDDDFGIAEATVICNNLGYPGKAQARKEGAFGEGNGVIWLDQLHCSGNESNLDECFHQQWGQHDCQHQEDVAVICSQSDVQQATTVPTSTGIERRGGEGMLDVDYNNVTADNILPKECGTIDDNLHLLDKDFTPKVVKGQEVFRGTHPWQASIRVRTTTKSVHWCGAVIISPLHILTTAHCLVDYSKSAYFIRAGDFDTEVNEESEQEADFESIYIHEDYNKGLRLNNDLALIKLKGLGLKFDSWVRPACLPTKHTKYQPGINCTISGWGSNGQSGSGYARRLRAATAPILPKEECKAPYVYGEALSQGMFCAGDLKGGVDSCQGDSGGPFVCPNQGRSTLYGITSWGLGCGRPNKPGVYTKVSLYLDWIHRKLHDSLNGR